MVSKLNSIVSNTWASGMNVVVVPARPCAGPIGRTGPVGLPRSYSWRQTLPSRADLDRSRLGQRVDDADADAVEATRDLVAAAAELAAGVEHGVDDLERVLAGLLLHADRARRGRRPSCAGCHRPGCGTSMCVAWPAIASSMELSTTSHTRWWRPRTSVEPMYMPGRRRTASRPSRTWMESAPYAAALARCRRAVGALGPHAPRAAACSVTALASHRSAPLNALVQASQVVVVVPGDGDAAARRPGVMVTFVPRASRRRRLHVLDIRVGVRPRPRGVVAASPSSRRRPRALGLTDGQARAAIDREERAPGRRGRRGRPGLGRGLR